MENSNENIELNPKLEISFPTSSEDHRLQLVGINGSIFAIVHSPLESLGPIRLYCEEWSLILLAPIKSKTNIVLSAINLICLSEIASEEGNVNLHATNWLVKFEHLIKPSEKVCGMGEQGEFLFGDDPGALLYYYRLFNDIVSNIRSGDSESLSDAQQKFIASLCTIADKASGKTKNLNLKKVLNFWGIPNQNQ